MGSRYYKNRFIRDLLGCDDIGADVIGEVPQQRCILAFSPEV
jgi:hypothetical protein